MEIPVYNTLWELESNYLIDYSPFNREKTLLEYLRDLEETYTNEWRKWDIDRSMSKSEYNGDVIGVRKDGSIYTPEISKETSGKNFNIANNKISHIENIQHWLKKKIKDEKINLLRFQNPQPQNIDFPETEPYQTETGKGKNIPYKLELLKQLGIMDNLNSKYDNNKEQLYRILDFLTGGNSKNYYLSMYGDNYNGKDKVTPFHTAYLRKNGLI